MDREYDEAEKQEILKEYYEKVVMRVLNIWINVKELEQMVRIAQKHN